MWKNLSCILLTGNISCRKNYYIFHERVVWRSFPHGTLAQMEFQSVTNLGDN